MMQPLAIDDPNRKPRAWHEYLRQGQYAVFLRDAESDAPVTPEGQPATVEEANICYVFGSLPEARSFCERQCAAHANLYCEIYDGRGKAFPPLYTIVNPRHEHQVGSDRTARLLMVWGGVSALLSILLVGWDAIGGWERIWPSVFGVNAFALGFRLVYWGRSLLEKNRTERAAAEAAEIRDRELRTGHVE
jgi:hypothetical protein